ncbi:MAG: hypothetical protein AAF517_09690, partial [Planctomycetota bacterium]
TSSSQEPEKPGDRTSAGTSGTTGSAAGSAEKGTGTAKQETGTTAAKPADPTPVDAGKADAAKNVAPGGTPAVATANEALSLESQAMLEQLKQIRSRVPFLFLDLKRDLSAIDFDLKRAIKLGEEFRAANPTNKLTPEIVAYLGRDYLSRYKRHLVDYRNRINKEIQGALPKAAADQEVQTLLKEEAGRYLSHMRTLGQFAFEKAQKGTKARYLALGLQSDIAEKDFNFREQIRYAKMLLEEFPDAEHRSKFQIDVGKALFYLADYESAAKWMREVISKHKADREYAIYNSVLFESLNGIGDLEGMEKLMRQIGDEYPERIAKATSGHYKGQYSQWYNIRSFWIGFARYALGDVEGARSALLDCQAHLQKLRAELIAQKKDLPSVEGIILKFRVNDVLHYLDTFHGKEPVVSEACAGKIARADMEDGVHWVTPHKISLESAKGKIVPILFRLPETKRTQTFLQELDELGKEMDDVAPMTLAFLPSKVSQEQKEQRFQKMVRDLDHLEVDMPAGFDMSPNQCVFRSVHATVGTGSFIVYDKEGRAAWYLPDPRDMDRKILERVLKRLRTAS